MKSAEQWIKELALEPHPEGAIIDKRIFLGELI